MKSLIDKNKKISKQRQEFVEHNFEAMVGARKRRYNETPQQKQRTEFLEDYYLLYTRNKSQLNHKKAMWNELKEFVKEHIDFDKEEIQENKEIPNLPNRYYLIVSKLIIDKMQELEGEKDVKD